MTAGNAPKYGTLVPNRVFVGGISPQTTEEELQALFSNYGNVVDTKIIVDRAGVSKGYGFITFETDEEAKRLQADSDDIFFKDRKLNIAPAVKKQPFARMYEQPVVATGSLLCHNGVPYTFHNGMAVFPSLPSSPAALAAAYDYSAAAGVSGGQFPQHVAMYHPQPLLAALPPPHQQAAAAPSVAGGMAAYNTTAAYPAATLDCRFSHHQQQPGMQHQQQGVQQPWQNGGTAAALGSSAGAGWRWPVQYNAAPQIGAVTPTPYLYLPQANTALPFFSAASGQTAVAATAGGSEYYQLSQPLLYHPHPGSHPHHQQQYTTPTAYDAVPLAIDREYSADATDDESRLSAGSVGSSLAPPSSLLAGDRHSPGPYHTPALSSIRSHTHPNSQSKSLYPRGLEHRSSLYRWLLPTPMPAHQFNIAANPSVSSLSPLSHRCAPLFWPQQQQAPMAPPAPLLPGHRVQRGAYQSTRVLLKAGPPPAASAPSVPPAPVNGADIPCSDASTVLPPGGSGVTMTPPPTPNRQPQQQQQQQQTVVSAASRHHGNHSGSLPVGYHHNHQPQKQQSQIDKTGARFQAMTI